MAKFKVGDKVRILDEDGINPNVARFKNGEVAVVAYSGDLGVVIKRPSDGKEIGVWSREFRYIEKVSDKPTKNQRITTLESQVAELQAEVAALKKAQATPKFVPVTTDNIAVGDKIRVIDVDKIVGGCDSTNGKIYEVVDVEGSGDFFYRDNAGDLLVVNVAEFSAVEKVVSE